jgi:methylase of polypeptide subunit release factors
VGTVSFFHQFKGLRNVAKVAAQNINLKQKFYGGKIFLNAVDHSWAWTGTDRYESFDGALQKFIYDTSVGCSHFIDIGCNIGVMSIGTLFNNQQIKVVAVDANKKTIRLLKR